jgi:hypothetical protein
MDPNRPGALSAGFEGLAEEPWEGGKRAGDPPMMASIDENP